MPAILACEKSHVLLPLSFSAGLVFLLPLPRPRDFITEFSNLRSSRHAGGPHGMIGSFKMRLSKAARSTSCAVAPVEACDKLVFTYLKNCAILFDRAPAYSKGAAFSRQFRQVGKWSAIVPLSFSLLKSL